MKKAEMEKILKENDGFSLTIREGYEDNGKAIEEKYKDLKETLEAILIRLGDDDNVEWNDQTRPIYQWISDNIIIALYNAGMVYLGYETNDGKSADYDIRDIYENKLCEDF